jgi:L-ascorbate metabolism protein UlaG (beta-lactamase superfamily)
MGIVRAFRSSSLEPWSHLYEPAAQVSPGQVRAVFLGVSTILLDDGRTAIMTDGFFSRPGLARLIFGRLRPDRARVAAALARFGISRLDAVFVAHSHYDHALDAAVVAELTGARLIGSVSTRNIARGQGFPDDRFDVAVTGEPFDVGSFRLTALPAAHSPGDVAPGTIDEPLSLPARVRDYKTGGCYSLHVRHGDRELLVHASANVLPGALDGCRADTVYLGIGTLGKQDEAFRARYWNTLVTQTGARRVVPVHWDNFTVPLDKPLRPLPGFADDFTAAMEFLTRRAAPAGVTVMLPVLGRGADPFAPETSASAA